MAKWEWNKDYKDDNDPLPSSFDLHFDVKDKRDLRRKLIELESLKYLEVLIKEYNVTLSEE